jgi:hypothetical protein
LSLSFNGSNFSTRLTDSIQIDKLLELRAWSSRLEKVFRPKVANSAKNVAKKGIWSENNGQI